MAKMQLPNNMWSNATSAPPPYQTYMGLGKFEPYKPT